MQLVISPTPVKAVIAIVVLLLQPFLQKLAIADSIPILKILDEIVVLILSPYALRVGFVHFKNDVLFRRAMSLLLAYWFISLVSYCFGSAQFSQFIYQFLLDIKYIVVFLYCLGAYRPSTTEHIFTLLFKVIVLINIPLVLVQMISPVLYDSLFPLGAHKGIFQTSTGGYLSRTAGAFWFTGQLALFSCLSAGYFLIRFWLENKGRSNQLFALLSLGLLVTTLSRGEIASFILASGLTYLFFFSNQKIKPVAFILVGLVVSLITLLNMPLITKTLLELGLIGEALDVSPRAKMMAAALSVASENFPLGAGLGTLGGQAAVVFDSELFYVYGFQYEWFFERGLYLTDTYWPKIIAESGFFGMFALLIFYLYPAINAALGKYEITLTSAFTFFSILALFINSLSSPIYNSALFVFLVCFLIGGLKHKGGADEF
ncbi:MAG: hypothetical protein RPS47_00285 [Colwellia sp.]|jgi:hypothetical protein